MPDPSRPKNSFHNQIGSAVSHFGKAVTSPFGRVFPKKTKHVVPPASSPGIEYSIGVDLPPSAGEVKIECIDYSKTSFEKKAFQSITDLLAHPEPSETGLRWINIEGLHPFVINEMRKRYDFHSLAAEDVYHVPQRSKIDQYDNHCLMIMDMVRMKDENLLKEQVSFITKGNTLITFQEMSGDIWDPVRARMERPDSRFRKLSIWYLVYALVDAIIDNVYPILEHYGDTLADLEERAMLDPQPEIQQQIYLIKRELYGLRRSIWPMRELASKLAYEETSPIEKKVRLYMRDVHDHVIQIIELIESSREVANSLQDFYISIVSNRMNEVMKALTIMASLFMPITFIAGVYGMNFDVIPELDWPYSYPVFWGICILTTLLLLWYFKKKRWIG